MKAFCGWVWIFSGIAHSIKQLWFTCERDIHSSEALGHCSILGLPLGLQGWDAHVSPFIGVFSAFALFHMIVLVLLIRFQVQGEIARLNREKPYDYNIHVHEK